MMYWKTKCKQRISFGGYVLLVHIIVTA